MLARLLFLAILHIVHSSCPGGFELVKDGECRGLYANVNMTVTEAYDRTVRDCNAINGQPIIIHDSEHQDYWMNWREKNGSWPSDIWSIGLSCNTKTKRWTWADGSALDYKPPQGNYDTDLSYDCKTGCGWFMNSTGYWRNYCTHDSWYSNVFCTTQSKQPTPTGNGCDPGFEYSTVDGLCYKIFTHTEYCNDGQSLCRSIGADLVKVHSSQVNMYLRQLALSYGVKNSIYLGAVYYPDTGVSQWVDRSAWDYQNYYPGYPKNNSDECITMDLSTATGQWMNDSCGRKLAVVCSRNRAPLGQVYCDTTPIQGGGVVTSPGYPYSASTPCDFFLAVDQGKKVKVEITLEANKCCDYLTVYDAYQGGNLIANLTSVISNATYTLKSNYARVSWMPKGGVNVKGMALGFRGV